MIRLIVKDIKDCPEEDTKFGKAYVIHISLTDDWKFHRWLDLMNSYDDFRKSSNNFQELMKEIKEDYDKDFKKDDEKLW